MVCDNEFKNFSEYANASYFGGNMLGILVLGIFADWYGRKRAYQFYSLASLIITIGVFFIDDPKVWLVLRFLCGTIYLAQSTAKNVWQVEITSGIWRSRMQHWGHEIPIQLGIAALGGLIFLLPGTYIYFLLSRSHIVEANYYYLDSWGTVFLPD